MRYIIIFIIFITALYSKTNKDFKLYKKDAKIPSHTLLIIGGIHGDEPGGYFAPAMIERYYTITKGSVWVAPSVNIDSMIANQRGVYKDMNRKFSNISKDDADFNNITKIKELILDKRVDLVLNLHDGHGFYRQKYENAIFNPRAWGQATIIDQKEIDSLEKFGNLDEIATTVKNNLNKDRLFQDFHHFGVKNTETKFKDEQQQLSLTFFAVTNNKPAFAIETSKNITDLTEKVIYQLKSIEEFMKIMDIEYKRDFDINNFEEVKSLLFDFSNVKINQNIEFNLNNIRKVLRFIPMKKDENSFIFNHPLGETKFSNGAYEIYVGNILVTSLIPQYFDVKERNDTINLEIDNKKHSAKFGDIVEVNSSFKILNKDYRVNVIGFSKNGVDSEDNIELKKSDMVTNFSIDNQAESYRVEFYKDGNFYGMIVIKFTK